jgi:hypothetical protein
MTEEMSTSQNEGLVIYDKADRPIHEHNLPTKEDLEAAASEIPAFQEQDESKPNRHFVSLSPGMIKVAKASKLPRPKSTNYSPRKPITEWSAKSRSNMVSVLCSLDYRPMFEDGHPPALITLTYPKNFKTLCPDAKTARRHLKLFRQRYERKFGKLRGMYKWEFQRSGSPHVHIFLVPPIGHHFKEWLSQTWADIVGESDPIEYEKHLRAGTAVDYETGARSTDTKRIVVYFLKHSSPTTNGQKNYQNQVPEYWKASGSVGRFWGRWGLEVATAQIEVSESQAIFVSRVLRKLTRANSRSRKVNVWRVNQKTGVVKLRKVSRRPKRMTRTQGFCSVNDGSKTGSSLARAIMARFCSSEVVGLSQQKARDPKIKECSERGSCG